MSKQNNKITIEELKAYLYSLENEKTEEIAKQINGYKEKCEEIQKDVKAKDIDWIQKQVEEEYQRRNQTKDKILSLLDESATIQRNIEKLRISKYMLYRVDIIRAERIIEKAIKRLNKKYKETLEQVLEETEEFPQLESIQEIDSSICKTNTEALDKVKEKFKEEYTNEQKMDLIKKELDIIEKLKAFYTTPIPHEILKNSDREIQTKMQKFNSARQKRLIVLSSMESDYMKLIEPREINCMIDDALLNIENTSDILTESEYKKVKNKLLKRRKKIFKSTKDIRSIIKYKEKKSGIINYNILEARYQRMDALRDKIAEAANIIKMNSTHEIEKKLKKVKETYEKEKQFAAIISGINEDMQTIEKSELTIKQIEENINSMQQRIEKSKQIIKEQEDKMADIKRELSILWKIEIESTISNKKEEFLELGKGEELSKDITKKTFLNLKSAYKAKHEYT